LRGNPGDAWYDPPVRIALWHGWLLEGSGSNVGTARVAEVLRASGHDVLLVCQEGHPERYPWIDAFGTVDDDGPSDLVPNAATAAPGRCVLLRPRIGPLLPVFVVDEYEGFDVKRFVDLTDAELDEYLYRNVEALRQAVTWHRSDVVIAGHAFPGPVVAKRALGPGRYVAHVHGSDLEYAIRPDHRYRSLANEGLVAARAVVGASADVLDRTIGLVPGIEHLLRIVPPGVAADFRPRPRAEALLTTAASLDRDPETAHGRPVTLDAEVERALERRDAGALDELATAYDQQAPDPGAAEILRSLAPLEGPLIGYIGKLIPQKGVPTMLAAAATSSTTPPVLVVGFGSQREWLHALVRALRTGDDDVLRWLRDPGGMPLDAELPPRPDLRVSFTGRLDHRYAPGALAALDVLVVPSILDEAFGMVSIEGAAAGALPLVSRHSALAEVAHAFEDEVGHPGQFSFEPGAGAVRNLAERIDDLVSLPSDERGELRERVAAFATRRWSWERTASLLLEAGAD
jgi:glycosyltransferase involved in cell wall biosynthesis